MTQTPSDTKTKPLYPNLSDWLSSKAVEGSLGQQVMT